VRLARAVRPALAAGKWVLCNRYVYSTYAYFMARGVALDFLKAINSGVERPDLTIMLDVPASTCRGRVEQRDGGVLKFEEKRLRFMEEVRENFGRVRDESFLVLDGTRTIEALRDDIRAAIRRLGVAAAPLQLVSA
jgi:dTMP kinase